MEVEVTNTHEMWRLIIKRHERERNPAGSINELNLSLPLPSPSTRARGKASATRLLSEKKGGRFLISLAKSNLSSLVFDHRQPLPRPHTHVYSSMWR